MFRKKGAISVEKIIGRMKGISYRLGVSRVKPMEVKELERELGTEMGTSGVVNVPKGYEFPHSHEEIEKEVREIREKIEKGRNSYKPPM